MSNKYVESLQATTREVQLTTSESEAILSDLMSDPDYLRQSSALINEALQKGFDVLQLANGDIVATGTKTVINEFSWDAEKAKLIKNKASGKKSAKKTRKQKEEFVKELLDDEA